MSNFGFNIPDSLKRNSSAFGRSQASNPAAPQAQGSAPGFTNVFNKASFSNTLPTVNAGSSQPPQRVFGSNMGNNSFSAGFAFNKPSSSTTANNGGCSKTEAQQANGPSTSSIGLSHNSKQQLISVLGDKLQKSSAESLFNRKPLPTASTFSQFNQQMTGNKSLSAKLKGGSRVDGTKNSFDGFGGPRAKGTSTGFNFKHRSPSNRSESEEHAAASSSTKKPIGAKKRGTVQRGEDRQNRAGVDSVWMADSPMKSALRTTMLTQSGVQPISAGEQKKRRSSDDMALCRSKRNLLERSGSNEGKSPATTAAMAIKRKNMRLPAQRNRQAANELSASKPVTAIPRSDRSKHAVHASSLMQILKAQTLLNVESSQPMKASTKEDVGVPSLKRMKRTVGQQLRALIGTCCVTNVERYQILKKRDELMYKTRTKNTDVLVMDIVQGKCPDMCPEKERYMRETQKNLNRYECDQEGEMMPSLTVKDYSRSAADQEEPLPHELRPPHVLQMTMNYLMNKIANEIPSSAPDLVKWYDFLWSRTRSIRKDITQQMLNDEVAVNLVEKCARFHIFASFRLASLDVADFNQKMNSENLSKCLQTLRHMYDDLAAEGIFCASESEFRSYDVILNLADSNVHGQVLSYRDEVRRSPEVQLALSLATSLQNNNYVRFFRQLKNNSSFLQACLCQRYFSVVRHSALKTICYAYRLFPLDRFIEILAFDNSTNASDFLLAFGIEKDQTDNSYINVTEGRSIFAGRTPDPNSMAVGRSTWLEMKIGNRSLAEVLCNGPCERVQVPEPVDSFDADGCYIRDPFNSPSVQELQSKEAVDKQQAVSKLIFSSTQTFSRESSTDKQAKPFFSFTQPPEHQPQGKKGSTSRFSLAAFPSSQLKTEFGSTADKLNSQQPFSSLFDSTDAKYAVGELKTRSSLPNSERLFNPSGIFDRRPQLSSKLDVQPSAIFADKKSNRDKQSHLPFFTGKPEVFKEQIPSQPSTIEIEVRLEEERKAVARTEAEEKRKAEILAKQRAEIEAKQQAEIEAKRKQQQLKLAAEQFVDSQVKEIMDSVVQKKLELIAATVQKEVELFQSKLNRIQDNLFNMWLRQFTDHWKSVVKRNRLLRSITIRQQEGITIEKARRSIAELCSPLDSAMPQTKRRRITADRMELFLYARHYQAVRSKELAKVYFVKWRKFVVNSRKRSYFESFFIQAAYMGSYENGKWTNR